MKCKTSFCDPTVLKKDLTRFFPAWLIYLIGGLLLSSLSASFSPAATAESLQSVLCNVMPWINCIYALVVAQLLFGDLFNSRLCNALHAMPLRRETWFFTHYIAGVLMAAVPNLLLTPMLMLSLESLWFVAPIFVGGSLLMFLFFFSLACLCIMGTGNRFAALLVYALINFFSMEIYWLFVELILPMWNGVRVRAAFLYDLCPVLQLMNFDYFLIQEVYPDVNGDFPAEVATVLFHFSSGWGYLAILTAIAVGLSAAALLLYRRRKLEVAGDFAAVKPVGRVVSVFGSLLCGMVFRLFYMGNSVMGYLLLFAGVSVGFFFLQMLLQRNVKIFTRSSLLRFLILVLVLALVLVGGATDILGIERYVPDVDQVSSVLIINRYVGDYEISDLLLSENPYLYYGNVAKLTEKEDVQTVLDAHAPILEEGSTTGQYYTIAYTLKNGKTVLRTYNVPAQSKARALLDSYLDNAAAFFGVDSAEQIKKTADALSWSTARLDDRFAAQIIDLLWADVEAGNLGNDKGYGDGGWLYLSYRAYDGSRRDRDIYVVEDSKTYQYIYGEMQRFFNDEREIFGMDFVTLAANLYKADTGYGALDLDEVLDALKRDLENGTLSQTALYHLEYEQEYESCMLYLSVFDGNDPKTIPLTIWKDAEFTFALCQG